MISLAFAAILSYSCEKPATEGPAQEDVEQAEPVGSYIYNGTEYPVYTAASVSDDNFIAIKISPLKSGSKLTTYAIIGIHSDLEGNNIDVNKAWHNDDYYFIYEDPVMYYSQYRELKSGTIRIKRGTAEKNSIYVKVDVVLPDGADFKFEYNGVLEVTE